MSAQPYEIDFKDEVINVAFTENVEVTPEYIMQVIEQTNKLHDLSLYNSIWDFRATIPSEDFGYDAVNRIVHYIENHPSLKWSSQTALLTEEGVQYGLSRIFQTLADQFSTEVQIFNDHGDALSWVSGNATVGEAAR